MNTMIVAAVAALCVASVASQGLGMSGFGNMGMGQGMGGGFGGGMGGIPRQFLPQFLTMRMLFGDAAARMLMADQVAKMMGGGVFSRYMAGEMFDTADNWWMVSSLMNQGQQPSFGQGFNQGSSSALDPTMDPTLGIGSAVDPAGTGATGSI